MTDLIAGQVQMAFGNFANYLHQALAGKNTNSRGYLCETHPAGAGPIGGTPQEFADFLSMELTRWTGLIRAAGISKA